MRGRSRDWSYLGTSFGSGEFKVQGVNVWEHKWEETGETVNVRDPSYGMPYTFNVYAIEAGGETIRFAAGEYSADVWGFYTERRAGGRS